MAEVVDLKGQKVEPEAPVTEIVGFLKMLLQEAEQGEIRQLCAVYVTRAGLPLDGYVPGGRPEQLVPVLAGLELCKATIIAQMLGGEGPVPAGEAG